KTSSLRRCLSLCMFKILTDKSTIILIFRPCECDDLRLIARPPHLSPFHPRLWDHFALSCLQNSAGRHKDYFSAETRLDPEIKVCRQTQSVCVCGSGSPTSCISHTGTQDNQLIPAP